MTTPTVRDPDDAPDRAGCLAAAELGISKEDFVRRGLRKIVGQRIAADASPARRFSIIIVSH